MNRAFSQEKLAPVIGKITPLTEAVSPIVELETKTLPEDKLLVVPAAGVAR